MKHAFVREYDYSLVRMMERISIGTLCLFKIQNSYTVRAEIGFNQYEQLFMDLKQRIISSFGILIFEHTCDSFFILAEKLNFDDILKFISCYTYQDFSFYLVNCLGYAEFDLINKKESLTQVVVNVIEALHYAEKNDIKICNYSSLSSYLQLERSYMHDAIMFKHYSEDDKLLLKFQPIVSALSGDVLFDEALLKVKGMERSMEEMIISLERTGAVNYLDFMVLDRMAKHIQEFSEHHFSINISPNSILNENEFDSYLNRLENFSKPQNLILEITETSLKRDIAKISEFIRFVRKIGFRVAIDDFGSGSTSFKDLIHLNVDIIKLSGSMISNLDARSKKVIQLICDIADTLNIIVVAECIETKQVLEVLKELGVVYMQGYYFADSSAYKLQDIRLKSSEHD